MIGKRIQVSDEMRGVCPAFKGAVVYAEMTNSEYNESLWNEINAFLDGYKNSYDIDSIKNISSIAATREVYRKCGKDPSRYRPSGEALIRRALQGKGLYKVNTVVDLINLASIIYGYSIGGFDYDKIVGDEVILGIGEENEPYEGIGRGVINIAGLPVYRDSVGGIGTPTSDNERTKMMLDTRRVFAVVNGYDGNVSQVTSCAECIETLLNKYADATHTEISFF